MMHSLWADNPCFLGEKICTLSKRMEFSLKKKNSPGPGFCRLFTALGSPTLEMGNLGMEGTY